MRGFDSHTLPPKLSVSYDSFAFRQISALFAMGPTISTVDAIDMGCTEPLLTVF